MNDFRNLSSLILVPAFNAAKHLDELITRLERYVCSENMLFVNDGSTDKTLEIIKQRGVTCISFETNKGKGEALMAGFDYAVQKGYRSVLTIDADLQHLPEEIPRFLALDNGRRLVMGTRAINLKVMPFPRWLTNNLSSLIISIFSSDRVRDSQSGYRLLPIELIKAVRLKTSNYDLESELLFKAGRLGFEIAEVPVTTVYEDSQSYINPFVDTGRFIRQIWKRIWG